MTEPFDEHLEEKQWELPNRIAELESALAAMTEERDDMLRVCAAIRETAHDYEDRLNVAEAQFEAVEALIAESLTYLPCEEPSSSYWWRNKLAYALATTGPSLRECPRCKAVEKVVADMREEADSRGPANEVRLYLADFIDDLETAMKEEA